MPFMLILGLMGSILNPVAPTVDDTTAVTSTTARLFELKGSWTDHPDPGQSLDINSILMGGGGSQRSFPALLDAIDDAVSDDSIGVIALDLGDGTAFSMPQVSRMVTTIHNARDHGKKCIAWVENGTTPLMNVASACDSIIMTRVTV